MRSPRVFFGLQFVRFVAAFMIVVYHAVYQVYKASGVRFADWVHDLAWVGSAGVMVFFVISGFVMWLTSERKFGNPGATLPFLYRRVIRIYPIYWITAALYLAIPVVHHAPDRSGTDILASLLLLPGYASAIIPPGWTLAYEMYFYLCFALIVPFRPRAAMIGLTAFFIGSIAVGVVTDIGALGKFFGNATNVLLLLFLAGSWLAAGRGNLAGRVSSGPVLLGVLFIAACGFAAAPALDRMDYPVVLSLGIPSVLVVAVSVIAEVRGLIPEWIARWSWLGDSSYALYLVHLLVLALGVRVMVDEGDRLIARIGAVVTLSVLSVLAGFVLHYMVERPVLRGLPRAIAAFRGYAARTRPAPARTAFRARGP